MQQYKNATQDKLKVYNKVGEFVFLEPGESCDVDLPNDQEPRVLVVTPEPPSTEQDGESRIKLS